MRRQCKLQGIDKTSLQILKPDIIKKHHTVSRKTQVERRKKQISIPQAIRCCLRKYQALLEYHHHH
jgi:hypothetical protein